MSDIDLITTCMGRLAHLQQSLGNAASQARSACVVVDYSCPDQCGQWVEAHYPSVKVVRVPNATTYSPARARNHGAALADASWLCFFDADVILDPHFTERLLPSLQPGHFYVAEPFRRELAGTVICQRCDFVRIGGYDEVFRDWGGEDRDLWQRLQFVGAKKHGFPQELVTCIPHGDHLRVQHFAIKDIESSQTINMLYRFAKFDLMRLTARELSEEERTGLYKEAHETVARAIQTQHESQWRIQFNQVQSLLGAEIVSTLTYSVKPLRRNAGAP